MKTYRVVGDDHLISKMFDEKGWKVSEDPALLVFSGGEDVTPALYGAEAHPTTGNNPVRDKKEVWEFMTNRRRPKVGICRGGQFLNVMSGGEMWQDVEGHCESHLLIDARTNKKVLVTSTHHQMMKPDEGNCRILGYAKGQASNISEGPGAPIIPALEYDAEVVYYPETKTLCFQPHPEYGMASCEDYFWSVLESTFQFEKRKA